MVESTALEMRRTFTGTVGSNPTLSANISSWINEVPSVGQSGRNRERLGSVGGIMVREGIKAGTMDGLRLKHT